MKANFLLMVSYHDCGIVFVILRISLLSGQNSPYILLSAIGVMIETIVIMTAPIHSDIATFKPLGCFKI